MANSVQYVLVPVEPTSTMTAAAEKAAPPNLPRMHAALIYRAMINAAPLIDHRELTIDWRNAPRPQLTQVEQQQQIGRLAMRHEGDWWNAYYAMPNSMTDAIQLGSIRITAVDKLERKDAFMNLMRDLVADIIEDETGVRPTWGGEHRAPENERTGHG